MQTFRFCFFCQAFSSFSFLGGRFCVLGGIQWRLLVRILASADRGGSLGRPVAAGIAALALDLGRGPPQARPQLVGLDLDHRPPLALRGLPGALADAALWTTLNRSTSSARCKLRSSSAITDGSAVNATTT